MADQLVAPATVRAAPPPKAMLAISNPIARTLLSSRVHRPMSKELMVVTGAPWKHSFRGGAPVTVTLDGQPRKGYADLIEDPDEVARVYSGLIERVGMRHARPLGLSVKGERNPTLQEIRDGLPGHVVVRIRFDGPTA